VKTALGCWLCFTNLISLLKYISPDQTFYFTLAVIKVLTIMAIINKQFLKHSVLHKIIIHFLTNWKTEPQIFE